MLRVFFPLMGRGMATSNEVEITVVSGEPVSEGSTSRRLAVVQGVPVPGAVKPSEKGVASTSSGGALFGGVIFVAIWSINGGNDARCDTPVPFYLYVAWITSFALAACGCLATCVVGRAKTDGDGEQKKRSPLLGLMGCLISGVYVLGSMFLGVWYVYGNIWLWDTFPSTNATSAPLINVTNPMEQGTIEAGLGCDPDLYYAMRSWFIFTYVIAGLLPCCCCCAICMLGAAATAGSGDASPA